MHLRSANWVLNLHLICADVAHQIYPCSGVSKVPADIRNKVVALKCTDDKLGYISDMLVINLAILAIKWF